MQRFAPFLVRLIFTSALPWTAAAQSFDYADRPEYVEESAEDSARGAVRVEVSSHEDSVREVPRRLSERQSYADQTLRLDGLALITAGAARTARSELWAVSGPTYLLGAPIVHCGHGRPLAALASLLLRVSAPILGGMFISSRERNTCSSGETCDSISTGTEAGFFVGGGVAMLLDAALLADEELVVTPTPR